MSVRHFNYTSRKRILHSDTSIVLSRHDEQVSFDAQLRLGHYELPPSASVVVEAYRQTLLKRYAFGTAANARPLAPTRLDAFPDADALLFRVKVIDQQSGLLLAEADKIKPADPDGGDRPSFLSVRADSLSGEAWLLAFEDDQPVLIIEKAYGTYQSLLASPHFRWLVLPQVLRSLLERALTEDLEDILHDSASTWQSAVIRLAMTLTGAKPPETDDEHLVDDWITTAIRSFCRQHGFAQRYHAAVFQGGEA